MSKELYKKYAERLNSTELAKAMFSKPHLVRRAALTVFEDRKNAVERVIKISNIRAERLAK